MQAEERRQEPGSGQVRIPYTAVLQGLGDSSSPGAPRTGSTPRAAWEEEHQHSVGQSRLPSPAAWLLGSEFSPHLLAPSLGMLLQPVCAVDGKWGQS